jgi:RNA polymerase sigma-70 factor (ECF subfamily)
MYPKKIAREIYQKYQTRLRKFIGQKVANPQDVEEILQESLIAAVDCLPLYSGKSTLFTWICGIARHEIADYYRKKKIKTFLFSHLPWLEGLANEALGPEQIFMRRELEYKVKRTLSNLSEGYAEILRLKYYQGLTVEQIAKKLNETIKGVESKLFRARQAFIKVYTADAS